MAHPVLLKSMDLWLPCDSLDSHSTPCKHNYQFFLFLCVFFLGKHSDVLTSHCRLAARKQFLDYCNPKEKVNSYKWDPQVDLGNLSGSLKDRLFLDGSGRGRRGVDEGRENKKKSRQMWHCSKYSWDHSFYFFLGAWCEKTVTMDFPGWNK